MRIVSNRPNPTPPGTSLTGAALSCRDRNAFLRLDLHYAAVSTIRPSSTNFDVKATYVSRAGPRPTNPRVFNNDANHDDFAASFSQGLRFASISQDAPKTPFN